MTYRSTSEPFGREVAESACNHTAHVQTRRTAYIKLIMGCKGLDFEPRIVDSMLKLN
jgi:uncharacterized ferritin-like protein (DUF455 family)